jgi:predicted TIM-barrel fold metal-dependent hydrolase
MTVHEATTRSAALRASLDHPVIDTDGHFTELLPVFDDYVEEYGGTKVRDALAETSRRLDTYFEDPSDARTRRERGDTGLPIYWTLPTTNTLDRATSALPGLLHERLEEFGLDFSILYPTRALFFPGLADEEVRVPVCRAFNHYVADMFAPYSDRLTPAAMIPLHTPAEGVAELEHAVGTLGLKAAMIPTYVRRPLTGLAADQAGIALHAGTLDFFGIDSDHDYDPFWARCIELGVVPATHSTGMGWGSRRSYTNFMYNHVGHFAAASHAMAKALVMGGVTRRFPSLRVAFLECGAAWATSLYSDLVAHWKKRNRVALGRDLDPAHLDVELFADLAGRYGDERVQEKLPEIRERLGRRQARPAVDDWAAIPIESATEFRELFEPHFFYGCEADDPTNVVAFRPELHPYGARFRAMLSSDIAHWDVVDMRTVLEEAFELVEDGLVTEDDFADFTFANAVRAYAGANPSFFAGTAVADDVDAFLRADAQEVPTSG